MHFLGRRALCGVYDILPISQFKSAAKLTLSGLHEVYCMYTNGSACDPMTQSIRHEAHTVYCNTSSLYFQWQFFNNIPQMAASMHLWFQVACITPCSCGCQSYITLPHLCHNTTTDNVIGKISAYPQWPVHADVFEHPPPWLRWQLQLQFVWLWFTAIRCQTPIERQSNDVNENGTALNQSWIIVVTTTLPWRLI